MQEKIITAMTRIGITKEEAEVQLSELGTLISESFALRLSDIYPDIDWNSPNPLSSHVSEAQYISDLFAQHAREQLSKYFETITAKVTEVKKKEFYSLIDDISDYEKTLKKLN